MHWLLLVIGLAVGTVVDGFGGNIALRVGLVPPAPTVPHSWKKIGLWAVLLLGVGLLGLMAMSLLKSQRKS